jgi:hypothetical protein
MDISVLLIRQQFLQDAKDFLVRPFKAKVILVVFSTIVLERPEYLNARAFSL